MKMLAGLYIAFFISLLLAAPSQSATLDFDDLPIGLVAGESLTINVDGVDITFSGVELQVLSLELGFNGALFPGTGNQLSAGIDQTGDLIVEIESGYAFDFIEIENHVTGGPVFEIDIITGMAFDSNGQLLDSFTNGLEFATLTGPGITRATFGAFETAFAIDNFRFTVIPEPSTSLLMMAGLTLLSIRKP